MSLAHELRVLDLDSQIELLERVRLLTRFGSNLISIAGQPGAGKTWIAQRYLEAYAQDKNQSLLMCHPNQTDEQKKAILLNQVVANPMFNEHDQFIDSFARLIGDESCDLVIVVDDAHLLTDTLLAELWTLVLEAQTNPNWNVNVVLFSNGSTLEPVISRISYGQEHKPISLEIEQLRPNEAQTFLEVMVLKFVHGEAEKKKVRKQATKTLALPGALMALGERKMEKKIIIRSIIGSPFKILLLVLILLALIAGGYLWLFAQPGPMDKSEADTQEQTTEQLTTAENNTEDGSDQMVLSPDGKSNLNSAVNTTESSNNPAGATDDAEDLPPSVTESVVSVGNNDDGQRVVVPSNVVDALLQGEPVLESTVIEDAVDDAREQATISDNTSEPAPPLITFSFSKDELLGVSDRNYTLQLAAMRSLEEVQDFLLVHEMENKVRIYPTIRSGESWYIITYKDFPTIQQARNARDELPQSVQILQPWAKSMLQVHREIERAN
ncbi:AAA family ATPase [Vibrio hannami]|uniref:AAA family ATPase n=1 Tax=Vibrio hannami TaxID=2717094 RepID=UPI00240F1863|nr:AAA family ATPase [Vibrio hannami]MDG3084671.1 AAA family ATPase [Vibrio hannami]